MRAWILCGVMAVAASAGARSAPRAELSDAAIEQRKAELDAAFQQASDEAEREFAENVAFQTRLKNERLDFERGMLDARKRMLDALKGLPPARRAEVYAQFHLDETRRRQDFARRLDELRRSFRGSSLEERADARRALRRRRQTLEEQHRQSR